MITNEMCLMGKKIRVRPVPNIEGVWEGYDSIVDNLENGKEFGYNSDDANSLIEALVEIEVL
jgi:hypothetical protein